MALDAAMDSHDYRVGYLSRKALPIKRQDAEPLSRTDVQYDLLNFLFSNTFPVFTSPASARKPKITFRELYVHALSSSSRCSKVLKDKMQDTPEFALEFAKIALLTNVGRINTTMAFFPEMKTALRTYHPVPSLQKTDGNAQDAPRIKNCLKAALLPAEQNAAPATPDEVLQKRKLGQRPPTSVVNLVFVLANHAAPLASIHFDGVLNFLDLFLPNKGLASQDRANAFLWHMYHYLEDDVGPNPFDDAFSAKNHGKAPEMRILTHEQNEAENVDTPEELAWGRMMSNQRNLFLQKLVSSTDIDKRSKSNAPQFVTVEHPEVYHRSKSERYGRPELPLPKEADPFLFYVPSQEPQIPPRVMDPKDRFSVATPIGRRFSPSDGQERTMLQHAWYMATTTDPLIDSDEEVADQHVRLDYSRRLNVLSRIRRRAPSPR